MKTLIQIAIFKVLFGLYQANGVNVPSNKRYRVRPGDNEGESFMSNKRPKKWNLQMAHAVEHGLTSLQALENLFDLFVLIVWKKYLTSDHAI